MGVQVISRQYIQKKVLANTDRIVGFVPLPVGSRLNNAWIDFHVIADIPSGFKTVFHYGLKGLLMPVDDPDSGMSWEDVWDEQVSKDEDYASTTAWGNADLDTETAAASGDTEYEPGLIDLEAMMGTDPSANVELFKRRKHISFAANPVGWNPESGGTYIPTDTFKTQLRNGPTVDKMSVAMLGFSSPAMDVRNTVAGTETMPSEKEWMIFQFIDTFLEDMFKYLIGTTPGSTTDPGQDAQHAITELIEAATWEPDDSVTDGMNYQIYSWITWDVTFPGMKGISTIGSE